MANSYTWNYPQLDVHTAKVNGHDDAISNIHWRFTAVSDSDKNADGQFLSATMYGSCSVDIPAEGEAFTAFNDVTKDWCKEKVLAGIDGGKTEDELKAMLDAQIAAIVTPVLATKFPSGW